MWFIECVINYILYEKEIPFHHTYNMVFEMEINCLQQ
jgi:hypothetical protein